jgi:polysaccharide biosynthesis protein PslG
MRDPRLRPFLPILGILLATLALAAPAARGDERSPYGIALHSPHGAELKLDLDRAQAAGIGWVHVAVIWPWVESARGTFDWSLYDEIVAAARARNLEILATILYTPAWATSGPELTGVPDQGAWVDFCGRAAARYRGSIRYWGLWNEPNLTEFWSGSRQQYVNGLLFPGADAIHAANPDAKVGGPALAHLVSASWYRWLDEIAGKAGSHLDFLTHHVYGSDAGAVTSKIDGSTPFGNTPTLWDVAAPSVKEVLKHSGWWGRSFWLTETGWQSRDVGEGGQAANYTNVLNGWYGKSGRGWIDRIFFYEIKDGTSADSPSWGILRPDGSAKPAYDAYRDFIAAHAPAPSDGARLLDASVPGTMEAGQTITVRLTFQNTGATIWTAADGYRLGAVGDQDTFAAPRQFLAPGESVAPGQQKSFAFSFTAPVAAGAYTSRWQLLREGVAWFGDIANRQVTVAAAPPPSAIELSLWNHRFTVEVSWYDVRGGRAGFGRAVPGTNETGTFWFFDPANVELVTKVLDGRPLNGEFWFFYGALSDVEYWIRVTDGATGAVKTYHNPAGTLCGRGDTSAFADSGGKLLGADSGMAGAALEDLLPASVAVTAAAPCVPTAQDLCLLGGRFRVNVRWQTLQGLSGAGQATPVSDQAGTFWFFSPQNLELVVKVLDGRSISGKFWVFYGALSDVAYTITVTDTVTGSTKTYRNRQGNLCGLGDTNALD